MLEIKRKLVEALRENVHLQKRDLEISGKLVSLEATLHKAPTASAATPIKEKQSTAAVLEPELQARLDTAEAALRESRCTVETYHNSLAELEIALAQRIESLENAQVLALLCAKVSLLRFSNV